MNSNFFATNRQNLISLSNADLMMISSYSALQGSGDSAHPFKQDPNFWYLTGIEHADWQLIIDGQNDRSWLVAPSVDGIHQLFDGTLTHQSALEISGVNTIINQKEAKSLLDELTSTRKTIHTPGIPPYAGHVNFTLNPAPGILRRQLARQFREVKDCQSELSKLRALKQPGEIRLIEQAAQISVDAFNKTKIALASCRYEYEVEAELTYNFRRNNATHSFEPIVANVQNACTLHYVANSSELRSNSFLLIDSGARKDAYSADITRTFSIGEPSKRHKELFQAVQVAEREVVALIRPGLSLKDYTASADSIMKQALLSVGLMKNDRDEKSFRRYFPHAISHGLGLDVHESLGGYKEFHPGMVLTVEPGIYIPEESIGIRIEDDILVTENGHTNLTSGISTDL